MHIDKLILCRKCKRVFNFSAGEQEFFASKDLHYEPKRCPNCRTEARAKSSNKKKVITITACALCGEATKVPFEPKGHTPVYCVACLADHRTKSQASNGCKSIISNKVLSSSGRNLSN